MRAQTAHLIRLFAALPLLGACASGPPVPERSAIEDAIRHERFAEAVELAARLAEAEPGPEGEALHRRARVAMLLAEGRRATFHGRDEEALALFERALDLAPDSETARKWWNKTRRKISRSWARRASDLYSSGQFDQARAAYQKALEYWPEDELAQRGLASIEILTRYHEDRANHYYDEGVRSFADYWLERARSRFSYVDKYRPGDQRADRREKQVSALIARQRLLTAKELEQQGLWAAAVDEYRLVLELDPSREDVRPLLERAEREARAREILTAAEMAALRGEGEQARRLLAEGRGLTTEQTESYEELEQRLADIELNQLYRRALDLEHDFRYEEAIVAYDELLARTDFYLDARARRDTLAEYVAEAQRLWEEAEAAPDDATRLEILRQIEIFWPEYRDLQDRLRALTAGKGAASGDVER